ncbi:hypothetical protein C9374_009380 [Naegleria lovaniensis]|uniref:FZ domain-containing protein n=1 Tax=Naegleria lovaniensis TaxID=51637 RepID=A0AA88GDL9_NAELO|nr:uncharacterized protein C9374_009380 [Naegleria lovaniensis]KAG2377469.1 hypothetical protein C9374_009380 [Naegleria lovaniensis]
MSRNLLNEGFSDSLNHPHANTPSNNQPHVDNLSTSSSKRMKIFMLNMTLGLVVVLLIVFGGFQLLLMPINNTKVHQDQKETIQKPPQSDKWHSNSYKIPFRAFLNRENMINDMEQSQHAFLMTHENNLLNQPSRIAEMKAGSPRFIHPQTEANNEPTDRNLEPTRQFIVKLRDGIFQKHSKGESALKRKRESSDSKFESILSSLVVNNNVLGNAHVIAVVARTSELLYASEDQNSAIEWIGEYESRFKTSINFEKLESMSKRMLNKREGTSTSKHGIKRFNTTAQTTIQQDSVRGLSPKDDSSNMMMDFEVSIVSSLGAIASGKMLEEAFEIARELNSLFSTKFKQGTDFIPLRVVSENQLELSFSPLVAREIGSMLLSHPNVHFVDVKLRVSLLNKRVSSLVQGSNSNSTTPFYDLNILGASQTIAIADTGLDYDNCFFKDSTRSVTVNTLNTNRRKVVYYGTLYGNNKDSVNGHGTHVVGTALGSLENQALTSGLNQYHGVAPSAKVYFTDLENAQGVLSLPSPVNTLFTTPYSSASSVRIFSNSWGCSPASYVSCVYDCSSCTLSISYAGLPAGTEVSNDDCQQLFGVLTCCEVCNKYNSMSQAIDQVLWDYKEAVIVFAQGNDGDLSEFGNVGYPATAKNSIAVGAHQTTNEGFIDGVTYIDFQEELTRYGFSSVSECCASTSHEIRMKCCASTMTSYYSTHTSYYNENNLGYFSSRGPASGTRIKPDVVAPGHSVVSAHSDGTTSSNNCGTGAPQGSNTAARITKFGTSMAAPAVAGSLALIREFFQTRLQITNPKGALLKAALIHSAVPLTGTVSYSSTETPRYSISEFYGTPNYYDGFGKVQIGNLISKGDTSVELKILEGTFASATDTSKLCFRLKNIPNASNGNTFFKATLSWYDYPSSIAVSATLIHDLDLIVNHYALSYNTSANSYTNMTLYFGNGLFNETDVHNNVEHVEVKSIKFSSSNDETQMISLQILNKGVSKSQEFNVVTSYAQGYWETLPSSSCVYKTFVDPIPEPSVVDNSTVVVNSTVTSNNATADKNETLLNNSTSSCMNCTHDSSNSTVNASNGTVFENNSTLSTDNSTTPTLNVTNGTTTSNETYYDKNNTSIGNETSSSNSSFSSNSSMAEQSSCIANNTQTTANSTQTTNNSTTPSLNVTNGTTTHNETYHDTNYNTCCNTTNSTLISNGTVDTVSSSNSTFNSTLNSTDCTSCTVTNTTIHNGTNDKTNQTDPGVNTEENYYCHGILYSNITIVCSGHGDCVSTDECKCRDGYLGTDCSAPNCTALNNCSFSGLCIAPNNCSCFTNFFGDDCSQQRSYPSYNRCVEISLSGTSFCNETASMNHEILFYEGAVNASHLSKLLDERAQACHTTVVAAQQLSCDENCQNALKEFCCLDAFQQCNREQLSEEPMCRDTCEYLSEASNVVLSCEKYPTEKCMNVSFNFELNGTRNIDNSTNQQGTSCNGVESTNTLIVCSGRGTCTAQDTCECNGNYNASSFCSTCIAGFQGKSCNQKIDPTPQSIPYKLDPYSFGFTSDGDKIVGIVISSPQWPAVINCDMLIAPSDLPLLGDYATCSLLSGPTNSTLEITLGFNPTVVDQSVISFVATNPFDENILIRVYSEIVIGIGGFVPLPPTIVLNEKPFISSCDDLYLDASDSYSNDKRPLSFSFSAVSAPTVNDLNRLHSYIQTAYSNSVFNSAATLYIDMETIQSLSQGSYKIALHVFSMFKKNTTKVIDVTILNNAVPSLSIDKGLSSTIMIGQEVIYTPIISFPFCYLGNGDTTFSYSLDSTKSSASQVSIISQNSMLIFGPGYTELSREGMYYFVVTASSHKAVTTSLAFTVHAQLPPLSIAFDRGDTTISMEDVFEFRVVTFDSSPIQNFTEQEVIEIVCFNVTQGIEQSKQCENISLPITTTYSTSLAPGKYKFTASVVKGSRTSTASIIVTVVQTSKSSLLQVSIIRADESSLESWLGAVASNDVPVDPSKPLILQSYCTDTLSQPTYLWSVSSGLITLPEESLSKSYLIIPTELLTAGQTYSVSLLIRDGIPSRTGSASISFVVNSSPTTGSLEILPSVGSALTTQFNIKCGTGWITSNTPLTFKFMYFDELNQCWVPLAERSEMQTIKTVLPNTCLNTSECHLRIKVVAFDRYAASSEMESSVTVEKPITSMAISTLSSLTSRMITSSSVLNMASITASLGVITSISTETTTQQQREELSNVTATIVNAFIQSKWMKSNIAQTTESVSATLSIFSSMNAGIQYMTKTSVTTIADALANITELAASSSQIVISESVLNTTKKICDTLFKYITEKSASSNKQTKRTTLPQLRYELEVINNAYENLAISYLKSLVPDMPPSVSTTPYSFQYSVRSSLGALLTGLQGTLDGKNSFSLYPSVISNGILWSMRSLDIHMKSYDLKRQNDTIQTLFGSSEELRSAVSNIVEFAVMSSSNPTQRLHLVGESPLANITFEILNTANKRSLFESQVPACAMWNADRKVFEVVNSTNSMNNNASCKIVETRHDTVTAQVHRTGLFMLVPNPVRELNPYTPPGQSPIPIRSPQQPTTGNSDFDIAIAVVVCVVIGVVVATCFIVACLYVILKKMKRMKKKKAQQQVNMFHAQHIPMKSFPLRVEQDYPVAPPTLGTV